MIQFILGNSGSGKSHLLYETLIEQSGRHADRNYIVIVPEQFTMQTQKELVMLHPDKGIMNIDVLSFRRLAHRIFEEVGTDRRSVLTETGKNLMIRRVAIEEKERLKVLGGRMDRTGYVSQVKSVLSELMQYEITDDTMQELLDYTKNRPLLHAKLEDLQQLYRAFLDYRRDRYMKPEELLDVFCSVSERSELLKNSTIAFDGFTGFTPSQLNVLRELIKLCPKIYVTVTIDARENLFGEIAEHELFALSKRMIRSVAEAEKAASGTPALCDPIILGGDSLPRFQKGGALFHLEQNLFRKRRRIYKEVPEEISMHVSMNPSSEVHFAARTICRLVREEGYRYHDIAVITGKLNVYDHYVKKIFSMYEVPAFLDETRHILLNPCLEFVRGALLLAEKDFSAESMFRYLRTGMAGLTSEETDRLENYVLASGIRGQAMWEQEWTYAPPKMTPEELAFCNECRARVMERIAAFARNLRQKQAPLRVYADALCELLELCEVQQRLKDREQELDRLGEAEEAREYGQIYSILIALLDEMVDLLGDETVSGQEFTQILDAGFAEAKVGIIPPGIDQVQVGDIERSRLAHVKVLFFLGLNDGWVPARGDGGGIVSDMEREILQQTGVALAPSARENSYIQRFYLYQNLTKPQDRLYLSWCAASGDGAAMRPSYLVKTIQKIFPAIQIVQEKEIGTAIRQVTSKENGILYLTRGFARLRDGEKDAAWLELYGMYQRDEQYRERVRKLAAAAFSKDGSGRLSYLTSKMLYGETMTNSVTRLEQFAACAFAHFAAYGLHLEARRLYGVKMADLGIIFHRAMELFSRRIKNSGRDWTEITQKEQQAMISQCVDEISQEYGAGVLHSSAREEYTICRLKRILGRTVWALHEQLCAGRFRPAAFEVSFEDAGDLEAVNVTLAEKGRICLQGRIDRIDTVETDDSVYVKIIDYKSGMTQFDPVSLYYGLQLQLVVYLNAALEMEQRRHREKEIVPAGIFYYRMQDPVLEKEPGALDEQTQEKLLKKLRPDGILNSDGPILQMFDSHLNEDSLVAPVGVKKDGSVKAASSTATTEQFAALCDFVTRRLSAMGEQILDGEIAAEPFADRTGSACDYCVYSDVCGFDRKLPQKFRKRKAEIDKKEAWERIVRESEEAEEDEDHEVD